MNIGKKMLGMVATSALLLAMTGGAAMAQDSGAGSGGFSTGDLNCDLATSGDLDLTVGADDLDFGQVNLYGNTTVSSTSQINLTVDAGCANVAPWAVTIDAADFEGSNGWLPGTDIVDSDLLTLTVGTPAVSYTIPVGNADDADWAWGFNNCAGPAPDWSDFVPVQQGTGFTNGVGDQSILEADDTVSCDGTNSIPYGAPGTTTAFWGATLDLTGEYLYPDATYTSALTIELDPIV